MIDDPFRKILPGLSKPAIRVYRKLGLHPNHLTGMGLLFGIFAAAFLSQGFFFYSLIVWWIGRFLDGTDGIYARETKQTSHLGAHLDILSDMAAYSAMILGFAWAFPLLLNQWLIILFLYILCITGALSLGTLEAAANTGKATNRGLRLAAGIAEGGETGIAYSLFLLFPAHIQILANGWIWTLALTVLARLALAIKELK